MNNFNDIEKIVVYYPSATESIVESAKVLFGEFNVYSI